MYRLNNSNTFQEIRCKIARYKNSFFPDATSSWNNMISNFQDIPTFTSLKSHLLSFFMHFCPGASVILVLKIFAIFYLNAHFLFECPFYAIQRDTLAVNVIDILPRKNVSHLGNKHELYLYGHSSLDLIDNRQIILLTIKYVKDITRFSTSVT